MGAGPFVGERTHPTMRNSTSTQSALWSCCDLLPHRLCRPRRPPLRSPGVRQTEQQLGEAMAQVNTVRGPVDGGRLGRTLMHEHIFVLSPEIEKTADEWDEAAEQARAVAKLREL